MVGARPKRGEGMGRAAAADVLGGWVGMVPASPDHRGHGRTNGNNTRRRSTASDQRCDRTHARVCLRATDLLFFAKRRASFTVPPPPPLQPEQPPPSPEAASAA